MGQQAFVIHIRGDQKHLAWLAAFGLFERWLEVVVERAVRQRCGSCTRVRGPIPEAARHTRRYPAHSRHDTERQTQESVVVRWSDYALGIEPRRPDAEFSATDKG